MQPWYAWRLEEMAAGYEQAVLGLLLVVGLLYCFLGYRLFRFILGMTGFFLAGLPALVLTGWLTQGHVLGMAIAFVVGGLCGAVALFFLYKLGVFCLGFLGAMVITYNILQGDPNGGCSGPSRAPDWLGDYLLWPWNAPS